MNAALLILTVFLPVAGAILAGGSPRRVRWTALVTVLATATAAATLVARFPGGVAPFAETDVAWLGGGDWPVDVHFSIALDGLSLWLFGLTSLLVFVAVLISWEAIGERVTAYYRLLLLLETGMLGVFVARDILLFYIFFEFTLIPLFFLIGIWGSTERRYAAIKFFLFTLAGSVLTFLSLLAVVFWDYSQSGRMTFSIPALTAGLAEHPIEPLWLQVLIFLGLFAGFAVKVPLFPLHTWLPLAHTEAPTAGSVLLAGVLLKIGTYGFVRFNLPMLPGATAVCMPWMLWLSVAGIIYGALVALAQRDAKRLIAYSSVSHMGFCMLGVFALNRLALQGGVLQMLNHGLSTGGLFAVIGMLYERYHTRQISDYGGIARRLPILAFFMLVFTLSSIGLPGLNGFAGEFLLLAGMFQRAWGGETVAALAPWSGQFKLIAVLAVSGVVLGAWYMLWLVQRIFFGPLREPAVEHADGCGTGFQPVKQHGQDGRATSHDAPIRDLSLREIAALVPLCVFIVWIGVQPAAFLEPMAPTLDATLQPAVKVLDAMGGTSLSAAGMSTASLVATRHTFVAPKGRCSSSPGGRPGEADWQGFHVGPTAQAFAWRTFGPLGRWPCCRPGPQGDALGWKNQGPSAQSKTTLRGTRPAHERDALVRDCLRILRTPYPSQFVDHTGEPPLVH